MASGVDLLLYLNASCLECGDLGPPPDSILRIPPPPLPAFLQRAPAVVPPPAPIVAANSSLVAAAAAAATSTVVNASSMGTCSVQCDWGSGPGVEYVELPRQGPAVDDTWLFVLIASCAGVLLFGALLALLLFKCRVQRAGKTGLQLDSPSALGKGGSKLSRAGCEAVLYPCPATAPDGRVLWAALTPRGTTHHFAADAGVLRDGGSPSRCSSPAAAAALPPGPVVSVSAASGAPPPPPPPPRCTSFDNSGFVASDEHGGPAPESFPMSERANPTPRPRVSSPTRIEHPNLPPLNLMPGHQRTLRRPAPAAPAVSPTPVVL